MKDLSIFKLMREIEKERKIVDNVRFLEDKKPWNSEQRWKDISPSLKEEKMDKHAGRL